MFFFFFFNDTATTEIYTLSLHDALPIFLLSGAQDLPHPYPARAGGSRRRQDRPVHQGDREPARLDHAAAVVGGLDRAAPRSEEHTSELQSQSNIVCRLLLEKKKKHTQKH